MLGRLAYRLARFALSYAQLGVEERNLFTLFVLDKLNAAPLHAIITSGDEGIFVNGQPLDVDRALVMREFANAALDNKALNLINDQVRWVAFKEALATGLPPEGLLFYRAALWFSDQQKSHLRLLAQREQELTL